MTQNNLPPGVNLSNIASMVAGAQAMPEERREPLKFPWHEIRDYITVLISQMLAQQNVLVGENMLKAGAPGVSQEELDKVKAVFNHLQSTTTNLNTLIEHRLREQQSSIILPR